MALSYASDLPLPLGRPDWHRKYVVLPALFIAFGAIELPVRLLAAQYEPKVVFRHRGVGFADNLCWWYLDHGLVLRVVYASMLITTLGIWLALSIFAVAKARKHDAAASNPTGTRLLRKARLTLVLAMIMTVVGVTAPPCRSYIVVRQLSQPL